MELMLVEVLPEDLTGGSARRNELQERMLLSVDCFCYPKTWLGRRDSNSVSVASLHVSYPASHTYFLSLFLTDVR